MNHKVPCLELNVHFRRERVQILDVDRLQPGIVCLIKSQNNMAAICRAIAPTSLRWFHHVVPSETRGGSVAT